MDKYSSLKLINLSSTEKIEIQGGNPILVGMGVISTIIALGKAADQASEWFVSGWKHPK